ncbi:MAG: acetoacetate decarboxylase family protein [Deltaproteobacteria bacterium]|nr:acetoacetate decarboxylase family protein [Deltaproteobacteria bacterium]
MTQPISVPWSAPAFTPPPHHWPGVRVMVFPFEPKPGAVERILPPGMEPGTGPALITMLSYPQTPIIHPFKELVVMVPVRVGEVEGNYVPYIYVTTDEALIPGREIAGFPKKIADVVWERDGNHFHGSATRWGKRILSLEGSIAGPMPAEIAAAQAEGARRPAINYKLIPGPAGEIEIEEITAVQLELKQHSVEMGQGRVRCEFSELDPLAELVPDGDGPLLAILSDNTIPAGRVLRRIDRRGR